ncbi:odorant receptor Or1-like [Ptiloglossa arizonensis]|uniref:odorant receptor Or1-like n=1 Tax=Ptiloglossa arizonensis TaxID=3350558 RepID=UPI003F9F0395
MRILGLIFTLLSVCGCSRPITWTSPFKKFLYNVYAICVIVIVHAFVISQILDLVFIVDNQDDFSDNFYMTLSMIVTCFKMYNLLMTRGNIEILTDTLQGEPFVPMDIKEIEIRTRFDKAAHIVESFQAKSKTSLLKITNDCVVSYQIERQLNFGTILTKNTIFLMPIVVQFLFDIAVSVRSINKYKDHLKDDIGILTDFGSRKLTFRAWLPFDYSSAVMFTVACFHQAFSAAMCSLLNVACDSLFSGLLVHIYCQFEILGYRLQNIQKNENDSVKQCARHHNHIYKLVSQFRSFKNIKSRFDTISDYEFATMVNDEFKMIVFIQFLTSTSTVCFDLYRLTQKNKSSEIVEILFYASCTLMQIFYYCWYGNEVKLKSLEVPDMVFDCNWASLSNKTKRILLMIMTRATMPVEFTSGYIVSVNVESFKALLKTSYSAYNLLQQTKR